MPAWKREVNARLSAHRSRRGAFDEAQPALPGMESAAHTSRAARVAARVAQRYAQAPTYSEMLAAEAAKAARAAEAAAEAARAAHEAAMAVTDALRFETAADAKSERAADFAFQASTAEESFALIADPPVFAPERELPRASAPQYRVDPASLPLPRRDRYAASERRSGDLRPPETDLPGARRDADPHPDVRDTLADPLEEALVAPPEPLPARVLEFPRELIATRKARPRIAEGPLHDPSAEPEPGQLRIFEVEQESISHQPEAASVVEEDAAPAWIGLRLDAAPPSDTMDAPVAEPRAKGGAPFSSRARRAAPHAGYPAHSLLADMLPLHVAPFEDRLMAAVVDAALVGCAFLMFVAVFVACTPHPPVGKPAMAAAVAAFLVLMVLYQALFFTWGEATPGMRYAKIALCTFDDENPRREELQKRAGALLLSAVPLGLGFLWALFDDDRLSWHDRMTRTYQRSYK